MDIDEMERQETQRMAELRAQEADGVGFVSPLRHALAVGESRMIRRRWRSAMAALKSIGEAGTIEEARSIAAATISADRDLAESASTV